MKTLHLSIKNEELDSFIEACNTLSNVNYISHNYKNQEATIQYKYDFDLFYLGSIMRIKLQLSTL